MKKLFKTKIKDNAVLYVVLVKGLANNTFSRFMQIADILTSLLSVARTCTDWFIGKNLIYHLLNFYSAND